MTPIKIWLDALTSKQATLFGFIAKELIKAGHSVMITCRKYEYTVGAFRRLSIEPIIIGEYSEGNSVSKVEADVERMSSLLKLYRKEKPELLIAYPNPPAARIAFGVRIPFIALTDSPHSELPSRLTLPLATSVIFSSCIPANEIRKYVFEPKTVLRPYGGVDEVAWLLRAKPSLDYIRNLGLTEWDYVIIRPHEHLATYYKGLATKVDLKRIVHELSKNNLTAVVIPRYRDHYLFVNEMREKGFRIKLIHGMYDGVSLAFYARSVVTGGSTLAREAALLMTQGITYFPQDLYVNECVSRKGYPLHKALTTDEVLDLIEKAPGKKKVRHNEVLRKLKQDYEDIVPTILQSIEALEI